MPLLVACTSCGAKLRAPDQAAGRTLKCPKCGRPITVDSAPDKPTPVETVEPISPFREPTFAYDVPVVELAHEEAVELAHEEDTKACPFCGETVLSVAKKCKHCDEFIGVSPRADEEEKRSAAAPTTTKPRAVRGQVTATASQVPHALGNISLVFSIIGLVFSIFPCIGWVFGLLLCVLGLVLGLIGLILSLTSRPSATASPLAGTLVCLVGLGITAMWFTIFSGLSPIDDRRTKETPEMIANRHQRGAEVGRQEGKRAGEAEGFSASFASAEKEAYGETLEELYQSREFRRVPLYTAGVMIGFFILGFILQWIVLYVPRRAGYLRDIDWIVLPKEMTQVDLYDLSSPLPMESKRLKPPSAGTTLILLLILLPMIGCKSWEEDAWQHGYEANRSAAYQEGWREAAPRGEKEGKERGKAEAEHAAQTGRAWQLYTTPAFLALMFGIIVGLAVQYTVLWCCNDAGRVPEMVTVAFVPAMKHSLAYSILESRRKLLLWWEQEKSRLAAAYQLKAAQIQAVHDAIGRKLKVMTSLEELTQSRLLDLAQQELAKVVSDAEQKSRTNAKRTVACPHCGKTIAYPRKKVGKFVTCPSANCGRPIHLPANAEEN